MTLKLNAISQEFRDALQMELRDGERLIWVGTPGALRSAISNWHLVIFGVFWLGGLLQNSVARAGPEGGAAGAWQRLHGFDFYVLCLFVVIGIIIVLSPLWSLLYSVLTVHAVTSERILTVTCGFRNRVASVWPVSISGIERRDHRGDSGTVIIERGLRSDGKGRTRQNIDNWYAVQDARGAENAIRKLFTIVGLESEGQR